MFWLRNKKIILCYALLYPTELQLNKTNTSDTEAPFLDLDLSITNGIVSTKIYDKRYNYNLK